jgi:uncharacterized protein YeaO (DUF488 family)
MGSHADSDKMMEVFRDDPAKFQEWKAKMRATLARKREAALAG